MGGLINPIIFRAGHNSFWNYMGNNRQQDQDLKNILITLSERILRQREKYMRTSLNLSYWNNKIMFLAKNQVYVRLNFYNSKNEIRRPRSVKAVQFLEKQWNVLAGFLQRKLVLWRSKRIKRALLRVNLLKKHPSVFLIRDAFYKYMSYEERLKRLRWKRIIEVMKEGELGFVLQYNLPVLSVEIAITRGHQLLNGFDMLVGLYKLKKLLHRVERKKIAKRRGELMHKTERLYGRNRNHNLATTFTMLGYEKNTKAQKNMLVYFGELFLGLNPVYNRYYKELEKNQMTLLNYIKINYHNFKRRDNLYTELRLDLNRFVFQSYYNEFGSKTTSVNALLKWLTIEKIRFDNILYNEVQVPLKTLRQKMYAYSLIQMSRCFQIGLKIPADKLKLHSREYLIALEGQVQKISKEPLANFFENLTRVVKETTAMQGKRYKKKHVGAHNFHINFNFIKIPKLLQLFDSMQEQRIKRNLKLKYEWFNKHKKYMKSILYKQIKWKTLKNKKKRRIKKLQTRLSRVINKQYKVLAAIPNTKRYRKITAFYKKIASKRVQNTVFKTKKLTIKGTEYTLLYVTYQRKAMALKKLHGLTQQRSINFKINKDIKNFFYIKSNKVGAKLIKIKPFKQKAAALKNEVLMRNFIKKNITSLKTKTKNIINIYHYYQQSQRAQMLPTTRETISFKNKRSWHVTQKRFKEICNIYSLLLTKRMRHFLRTLKINKRIKINKTLTHFQEIIVSNKILFKLLMLHRVKKNTSIFDRLLKIQKDYTHIAKSLFKVEPHLPYIAANNEWYTKAKYTHSHLSSFFQKVDKKLALSDVHVLKILRHRKYLNTPLRGINRRLFFMFIKLFCFRRKFYKKSKQLYNLKQTLKTMYGLYNKTVAKKRGAGSVEGDLMIIKKLMKKAKAKIVCNKKLIITKFLKTKKLQTLNIRRKIQYITRRFLKKKKHIKKRVKSRQQRDARAPYALASVLNTKRHYGTYKHQRANKVKKAGYRRSKWDLKPHKCIIFMYMLVSQSVPSDQKTKYKNPYYKRYIQRREEHAFLIEALARKYGGSRKARQILYDLSNLCKNEIELKRLLFFQNNRINENFFLQVLESDKNLNNRVLATKDDMKQTWLDLIKHAVDKKNKCLEP